MEFIPGGFRSEDMSLFVDVLGHASVPYKLTERNT